MNATKSKILVPNPLTKCKLHPKGRRKLLKFMTRKSYRRGRGKMRILLMLSNC